MCAKAPKVQICHKVFVHDCSLVNRVKMDTSEFFALCFACLYSPLFFTLSVISRNYGHLARLRFSRLYSAWVLDHRSMI